MVFKNDESQNILKCTVLSEKKRKDIKYLYFSWYILKDPIRFLQCTSFRLLSLLLSLISKIEIKKYKIDA